MENTYTPARLSGALLILTFFSFAGIVASFIYSGYVAMAIGVIVMALALGTKSPEAKRDRVIVFSMAGLSFLLGCGAIVFGVMARALAQVVQAS